MPIFAELEKVTGLFRTQLIHVGLQIAPTIYLRRRDSFLAKNRRDIRSVLHSLIDDLDENSDGFILGSTFGSALRWFYQDEGISLRIFDQRLSAPGLLVGFLHENDALGF